MTEEISNKAEVRTKQVELKQLVVLFSDIVGITAFFDRYGDLAGTKRINTHNQLLFPIIESRPLIPG